MCLNFQIFAQASKTSCSEELNFTAMLSTVKYLVCFLGTELKKLMFKPKESLTPIKY